ncbi:MAG: Gfo/Idh/MocA family oxidoreductase [Candidatus Omnitrophota bacterium]|nr:Gfo/Idh/MocA family oxidoreductase [Candidatus Omnitrophota bacterium]
MNKLKVAVVGVGRLGSIHARIYKENPNCQLVAVCDADPTRLQEVASNFGVSGYSDYTQILGKVDALSVAAPTNLHHKIALFFLKHGIPVLVEKPFTSNLKEADELIKVAAAGNTVLQVGHIERFNSAFSATLKIIKEPKFIECHRLSPFPNRSLDVGAVLDIMIHDIDIILGLVRAKIKKIESVGVSVLTQYEDIANARITFVDGCVANLTASRVSDEVMRKIRIFQENTYISLDYKDAKACVYTKEGLTIKKTDLPIEKVEPLKKELESFLECAATGAQPLVSGETARDALAVAIEIRDQIWNKKI